MTLTQIRFGVVSVDLEWRVNPDAHPDIGDIMLFVSYLSDDHVDPSAHHEIHPDVSTRMVTGIHAYDSTANIRKGESPYVWELIFRGAIPAVLNTAPYTIRDVKVLEFITYDARDNPESYVGILKETGEPLTQVSTQDGLLKNLDIILLKENMVQT